jgi:GT2 family glycosyltransferase/capsular polysaccharide biosynthesis protein
VKPQVSIIIPLLNQLEMTRRCLRAIEAHTPHELIEVIAVDNASTDGTAEFLQSWKGAFNLRIISNETNLGYAKANNQGARIAQGNYLVLLNNDTEPQSNWIQALLSVFSEHERVGAVGAKLLYPDGTIQHAGVITVKDNLQHHPILPVHTGYQQKDGLLFNQLRAFPAVTGACMMLPKAIYQRLGGLDESYWNGYEDVDLCFKIGKSGYEIYFQPQSVVIHYESQAGPQRRIREKENLELLNQRWRHDITCQYVRRSADRIELNDGATIVIVTYNSAETIVPCLVSLKRTLREKDEVVIVDNASKDETSNLVRQHTRDLKQFQIIPNNTNRGYAAAANQGAQAGKNPYIAFLNPDTIVTSNWLERLVFHLQSAGIAAVGPLSNYVAGLQKAAFYLPEIQKDAADGEYIIDTLWQRFHHHSRSTKLLVGFCFMIKRGIFKSVNGFDDKLFLGNDDLDICWRLRSAGYQLVIAMDTIIFHKGQESFKSESGSVTERLVQESTDYLYSKLFRQFGADKVPTAQQMWGMDWFRPSCIFKENLALTSIVILTCDQLEYTRLCIESIFDHTRSPFELIIVDNGSKDGTVDYLASLSRSNSACIRIKLIVNKDNAGFAKGCNQGMAESRGDHLLLLNNDVVVTPGWLASLHHALGASERLGLVGPMSNYVSGPQLVSNPQYDVNTLEGLNQFGSAWSARHRGQIQGCSRVVGFCMLIKRAVVDKIGGLDQRFGLGNFEDDDYCIRARLAGYEGGIAKDCFIHHFGGRTFFGRNLHYEERLKQNWELFKRKWKIPSDTPLGKTYQITNPPKGFNPADHYIPLDAGSEQEIQNSLSQPAVRPSAFGNGSTDPLPIKDYCLNGNGGDHWQLLDKLGQNDVEKPYMAILENVSIIGPLLLQHGVDGRMRAINIEQDKVSDNFGMAGQGRSGRNVHPEFGPMRKGSYLMLWGLRTDNFWHWIMEMLVKVVMARACGFSGIYIVPPKFNQSGFIRESLDLIGIPPDQICVYDGQPWTVEHLYLPQHIDGNYQLGRFPILIDQLRQMLMQSCLPTPSSYKNIYIARDNPMLTRRITNETQLIELLFRYGFQRVIMENFSLKNQIKIAAGADFLIVPHGAGSVHSLFMPPRSTVIELFPTTYVNPCMLPVMERLEHRYFMVPSCHLNVFENDNYDASLQVIETTLNREFKDAAASNDYVCSLRVAEY